MKKFLLSFLALAIAVSAAVPAWANEVTIPDPESGISLVATGSTYLPIAINNSQGNSARATHSVSQQLYYASELTENSVTPSTNTIQAITFYYEDGTCFDGDYARKLQVWMKETTLDNFDTENSNTPHMVDPGTKVFSGSVEIISNKNNGWDGQPYTITFDTPFEWDGSSNIIVTVQDTTGFMNISATFGGLGNTDRTVATGHTSMFADAGKVRFLHKTCTTGASSASKGWDITSLSLVQANSSNNRGYVNKITFVFAPAPETAPSTPSDLAVSSVTANSATLAWSAVEGATSYDLQQSADNSNWSELATDVSETSFTWSGLSPESTQYIRIRAVNASGSSDWSEPVTVTTDAVHSHNGIEFDKWTSTNSMPTSGNYYLENNVTLDPYDPQTITLTGNLNLCLNGNTANLYGTKIVVPSGKTLAIYDNVGEGKLTGFVASEIGGSEDYSSALIVVKSGGTLVLKEGTIENAYTPDDDGNSYAIYSNGTINLSGDVTINSYTADIYLYSSNVITITGTLSNTEKHTVYKSGGTFTSGWSTYMSSEDPSDYFESADDAKAVYFNGSEAALRTVLHLSENSTNASIGTNYNQTVDISLTRSLTSAQYNTFCLPFALDDDQLQEFFGADYDLEELTASSLTGETLNLEFTKCTDLEAGKPYLLQPSVDVTNRVFEGVTITATSPGTSSTTYVDYKAVYSPTELEGENKNLLFLGAGNELFWPESTGNLNGFRAYFEIKDASAQAAKRARISMGGKIATGNLSPALPKEEGVKILRDGKLYLMYKGQMYDVQGKRM